MFYFLLFWKEQRKAAKLKDGRGMHPMMVKWALNLKMLSSYHAARTSGFMFLPSERTPRDDVHCYPSKPGFGSGVNDHMIREAKIDSLAKIQKHVIILLDEMKVREDVVLKSFETDAGKDSSIPVATHVLGIMVRGLVTSLKFPFAHFPTAGT